MRSVGLVLLLVGSAALADTAGPPVPARPRVSPAQAAMATYKGDYGAVPPPGPCQRGKEGEVVVCAQDGRGGSPDRLPLPDERGAADRTRLATGEPPHMGVGGSPMHNPPATGVTLTMKADKTTLAGNGAQ